jgi:aspartokinase-like uncharacterized kinase
MDDPNEAVRVVKVGGSLFDWPLLPVMLRAWLNEQTSAVNVLIAGGGAPADAVRQAAATFDLDDETSHWLCIDAMGLNSQLLASWLTESIVITTFAELRGLVASSKDQRIVFDSKEFLRAHEFRLPGHVLPHNWSVTSDSIAARLAEVLSAEELVLLKSADPPRETTTTFADAGFVDRNFPSFDGCGFRRRFVNLRQATNRPVGFEISFSDSQAQSLALATRLGGRIR